MKSAPQIPWPVKNSACKAHLNLISKVAFTWVGSSNTYILWVVTTQYVYGISICCTVHHYKPLKSIEKCCWSDESVFVFEEFWGKAKVFSCGNRMQHVCPLLWVEFRDCYVLFCFIPKKCLCTVTFDSIDSAFKGNPVAELMG